MTMDGSANDIYILDFGSIPTRRTVRILGTHKSLLAKQITKRSSSHPKGMVKRADRFSHRFPSQTQMKSFAGQEFSVQLSFKLLIYIPYCSHLGSAISPRQGAYAGPIWSRSELVMAKYMVYLSTTTDATLESLNRTARYVVPILRTCELRSRSASINDHRASACCNRQY